MFTPELIGIYIESEQLQYACLSRSLKGWRMRAPVRERPPADILKGPGMALLRDFLTALPPSRQRKIYLSLPRNRVFMRSFNLPAMPLEDALEAARHLLPVYCHLPQDQLYYDIQLHRRDGHILDGMLYYASRRDMDVYSSIFRETGHAASLDGIFPLSNGVAAMLACQKQALPLALIMRQEDWQELALFDGKGLSFSICWPATFSDEEQPRGRSTHTLAGG